MMLVYWAYRLGLYKLIVNPQINWLYPLRPFHKHQLTTDNKRVLKNYIFKAWPIALTEAILIISAVVVFVVRNIF